jgi:hypothetical protein
MIITPSSRSISFRILRRMLHPDPQPHLGVFTIPSLWLTSCSRILALFGEEFARQFLSESFTWLDHLIFACVPLGILTTLSGAIRVQGPKIARSFIGRARENRASAEIELMSSTSKEVCEMFNGRGIIRTMGRPTIAQIVIFPDLYNKWEQNPGDDTTCGIYTIQTAVGTDMDDSNVMTYKGMA